MRLVIQLAELGGILLTAATVTAFVFLIRTGRAYRQGYADGHAAGVADERRVHPGLADDVISLIPYLDRQIPRPGA